MADKMDNLSMRKSSVEQTADADLDQKQNEAALPGELISAGSQHLHRKLGGKEIQLLAVGGAIGTCVSNFRINYPLMLTT